MDDFAGMLAAAQRGDEAAFTVVFRAMQPMVLRYLSVQAGSTAAEDLAAETWLAALRGIGEFRGDERAFRGWLLTIARARWVDSVRKRARRRELPTDRVPDLRAIDDVHATVEQVLTTAAALELIALLPPDQAEVITLRVIGELNVSEVAVIVDKTANHVRVLAHRGLRRLAQLAERSVGQEL